MFPPVIYSLNAFCYVYIGIILVHDLTNRKSQQNLKYWLSEVLSKDGGSKFKQSLDDFDSENIAGSSMVMHIFISL